MSYYPGMRLKYGWEPDIRFDGTEAEYYQQGPLRRVLMYEYGDGWAKIPCDPYPSDDEERDMVERAIAKLTEEDRRFKKCPSI
jgi:hypothetical protein